MRPQAGYIGFRRTPTNTAASGVWTLREAESSRRAGTWPIAGADTYFSSVQLLLHLDGNLTDTSSASRTVTESGFSSSTDQSKWGSASRYNNSSSAYLQVSSFVAIGTGDYCLEAWVYLISGGATYQPLFDTRSAGAGTGGANFGIDTNSGKLFADTTADPFGSTTGTVSTGAWTHIAFARTGTTLRSYIGGTLHGSMTSSYNHSNASIVIGANAYTPLGVEPFRGYLSDVRITVGSSRDYTGSTITVPAAAFPDF